MNNDITGNYNNFSNIPKVQNNVGSNGAEKILPEDIEKIEKNIQSPMDCLNSMGVAQVKMTNPQTRLSAIEFLKDEEYATKHVEFCDDLVEKGYKLEDAIQITDKVFAHLKKGSTYKN